MALMMTDNLLLPKAAVQTGLTLGEGSASAKRRKLTPYQANQQLTCLLVSDHSVSSACSCCDHEISSLTSAPHEIVLPLDQIKTHHHLVVGNEHPLRSMLGGHQPGPSVYLPQ